MECNLVHRRFVAVLGMLFKIKNNSTRLLTGALPLPYVPARVTLGTLVSHRHSSAPPCCKNFQSRRTFVPPSVSLWDDRNDYVFGGVGLAGIKSRANAFWLV